MNDQTKQFVKDLRKLADLYEEHSDLPVPYLNEINVFVYNRDKLVEVAKTLAYLKVEKKYGDPYYELFIQISNTMKLAFNIMRTEVCERVKVGTKIVEVAARPAVEAHTEEIDQFEWHCPDALLK